MDYSKFDIYEEIDRRSREKQKQERKELKDMTAQELLEELLTLQAKKN